MAKRPTSGNKKRPTTKEGESLVRQANDAVFGPGPAGFVSKHRFAPSDVIARVRAIDWFVHCGEPRDFDVTMPVERVKTWPQAMKAMKSRAWATATLEAQNQLTVFLSQHHLERYKKWNEIVIKFKREVTDPLKEKLLEPFRKNRGLDIMLAQYASLNILGALMENAYMDCKHGCFFYHELLTVYEAGHLPCGWIGEWPQGKLVVY